MTDKFKKGERVFALYKCWPPWPAKISDRAEGKVESYEVWFYGTYNKGTVMANKIFLYNDENKAKYGKPKNPRFRGWKKAMEEIERNTLLNDWSWLPEEVETDSSNSDGDREAIDEDQAPVGENDKPEENSARQSEAGHSSSKKAPFPDQGPNESGYEKVPEGETSAFQNNDFESDFGGDKLFSFFYKEYKLEMKRRDDRVQEERQKLLRNTKKVKDENDSLKVKLDSAEREISQLRKALEEKTEEAKSSRHFLELEKKFSEETKVELKNCKNLLIYFEADIKRLQDKCKNGEVLLEEGRKAIGNLKEENQELYELIGQHQDGINHIEKMMEEDYNIVTEGYENKRKLLSDMKKLQPPKKKKQQQSSTN